ncbi:hypothetical protein Pfo_000477 [Paulownia fortunei]|nr:hypothetical protein Pfo_000477 [Paulownia fortunei]
MRFPFQLEVVRVGASILEAIESIIKKRTRPQYVNKLETFTNSSSRHRHHHGVVPPHHHHPAPAFHPPNPPAKPSTTITNPTASLQPNQTPSAKPSNPQHHHHQPRYKLCRTPKPAASSAKSQCG